MQRLKLPWVAGALVGAGCAGPAGGQGLDPPSPAEVRQLSASLQSTIADEYVLVERVASINDSIQAWATVTAANVAQNRVEMAEDLTDRLRRWSNDLHFLVFYPDLSSLPPLPAGATTSGCWAEVRDLGDGITVIEGFTRLPRQELVACAFDGRVAPRAAILDVRTCTGGSRASVQRLVSRFVPAGVHYTTEYSRSGKAEEYRTREDIENRWTSTELFILTGRETASGCEAVPYHLQALNRATVVGAVTRGAAHAVRTFDLSAGFRMFVPVFRTVNQATQGNWEGVGVIPDVRTPDPLRTAVDSARSR